MIAILGYILLLVGTIWLVVTAIQTGSNTQEKVIWGLVNFFCQPLGGIVFFIMRKQGMVPLILVIAGWIALVFGGGMAMFSSGIQMPN
jgi:peptidoglycan/LPS O-acetylase OafA/YrhL